MFQMYYLLKGMGLEALAVILETEYQSSTFVINNFTLQPQSMENQIMFSILPLIWILGTTSLLNKNFLIEGWENDKFTFDTISQLKEILQLLGFLYNYNWWKTDS